jgi:hypothetical protein
VDFKFTSQQLTLNIAQLTERVIQPAMVQIANAIDIAVMNLYTDIPQWVGTPGTLIQSFAGFAKGPTNLDQRSVPQGNRSGILTPASYWAMAGSQTALFSQQINNKSYRQGRIGDGRRCRHLHVAERADVHHRPARRHSRRQRCGSEHDLRPDRRQHADADHQRLDGGGGGSCCGG